MTNITEVTLDDIPCMCVVSESGISGSKAAFDKLESALSSLKGRKFYGAVFNGEYRACVVLQEGDDPKKLGFDMYTIPGGKYVRTTIYDWPKHLDDVGPTFDAMSKEHTRDKSRPLIEFYRSQKELILFMPT